MASTTYASVGDYIASQASDVRPLLRKVRAAVRRGLPGAEETISYQIPAYKLGGKAVLYFAGWKAHFSIYPATGRLLDVFKRELAPYKVSKGTIRFPLSDGVPTTLVERIARFRATEAVAPRRDTTTSSARKGAPKNRTSKQG